MQDKPDLATPPRDVPMSLRVRLSLGGIMPAIAWGLLAMGGFMAIVFVGNSELATSVRFSTELATTEGIVEGGEATNIRHNNTLIYRVDFAYEADGQLHTGRAYNPHGVPEVGSRVLVEYAVNDPQTARVLGMQTAPFPSIAGLILIVPLAGVILLWFGWRRGRRRVKLLRFGHAAWGLLTDRQRTSTKINNRRVHKLRFTYFDGDGARQTAIARSHRLEFFDESIARHVLYDPVSGRSEVVDLMPGRPRFEAGQWLPAAGSEVARVLILPAFAMVGIYLATYFEA